MNFPYFLRSLYLEAISTHIRVSKWILSCKDIRKSRHNFGQSWDKKIIHRPRSVWFVYSCSAIGPKHLSMIEKKSQLEEGNPQLAEIDANIKLWQGVVRDCEKEASQRQTELMSEKNKDDG